MILKMKADYAAEGVQDGRVLVVDQEGPPCVVELLHQPLKIERIAIAAPLKDSVIAPACTYVPYEEIFWGARCIA